MKKNILRLAVLLLAALTALAARASVDTTPPVLGSLTFAPGAVDVSSTSQTVSVNAQATDDASGVETIEATFRSPSGKQTASVSMSSYDLVSGNPISGVYNSTFTLNSCDEPGTWTLTSITIFDQCDNIASYAATANGSVQAFPAGTQTTLEVTNTTQIASTPQLVSLSFTPSGIDLTSSNNTVTVTAELSDSTAGVYEGYANFVSPSGAQSHLAFFDSSNLISGNQFDGVYQAKITFNSCDEAGNWTLSSVTVYDPCNNFQLYGSNGAVFPNGTQTLVTVTNPGADATPPQLVSLSLSSTEADVTGGEATVTGAAVATDNLSGISSGDAEYVNGNQTLDFEFSSYSLTGGSTLDGTFGVTGGIGSCSIPGVYTLKHIFLYDSCGNEAVYGGTAGQAFPVGVPTGFMVTNGTLATGSVTVNIYPTSAQYDGYTWNVDGGNNQFSGATVTGLTPGGHTINFLPLTSYGFTTPANHGITVAAGQTAYTSGTYISQNASDSITVNLQPSGIGGMWTVDDGPLQAGGATVSNLADGPHSVEFSIVTGYTAPASQVITTASNLNFTTTGTYSQITEFGSVTVTITPAGAVHDGAQWNLDGGTSESSGFTVSGIPIGQHSINFTGATGYTAPGSQVVEITNDGTAAVTGTYTASVSSTGSLTVNILPSAAAKAGAEWNVDGGAAQKSGNTLGGISGGNHTVNFTMVNGFNTPAPQLVSIAPNANTVTTGTYTPAAGFGGGAQSFLGLSASGNALLALALTDKGGFTGKFEVYGGPSLTLTGSLGVSGSYSGTAVKSVSPFTVQVTGSSPSTYLLTGSADGIQITGWPYAYVKGQVPAEAGKYNSVFYAETSGAPEGTGYGVITVGKAGATSIAGKLADGTGFSASNPLVAGSGGNAFIIFDNSIYKKKGLLSGMLTFVSGSGSASGSLGWIKPASSSPYYATGINAALGADAHLYTPGALPFTSGTVSFDGGPLSSFIIEPFSITGSKIAITGTSNPADVTLKIAPATGAISGTLLVPGGKKPVKYSGLLLTFPGFPRGAGFFLGPVVSGSGQSGEFSLPFPPL